MNAKATILSGVLLPLLSLLQVDAATPIASESNQLVVVVTSGWNSISGTLTRWERLSAAHPWRQIGSRVEVVVGRNGLAWGSGFAHASPDEPVKKEGDGRSPAGVFPISTLFGFAAAPAGFHLQYMPLRPDTECVDDRASSHYNQLLNAKETSRVDWKSSEKMQETGEPYHWGAVVAYNVSPPKPGAGSCIFLHIARSVNPPAGTAGCTAMQEPELLDLLHWLDAKQHPLLIQLPIPQYQLQRDAWRLPKLPVSLH